MSSKVEESNESCATNCLATVPLTQSVPHAHAEIHEWTDVHYDGITELIPRQVSKIDKK